MLDHVIFALLWLMQNTSQGVEKLTWGNSSKLVVTILNFTSLSGINHQDRILNIVTRIS